MKKILALFVGALFLAGCGSNPEPKTPDFTLSTDSSSLSIAAGSSGTVALKLEPINGFTGTPTFAITGAVVGTSTDKISGSVTNKILTLNVGSGVPTGAYPLKVTATSGTLVHNVDLNITVTAATGDFTLNGTSSGIVIAAGASGTVDFNVVPSAEFSGVIKLTLTGAIVGTGSDKIAVSSTFSSNVFTATLAVGANVPAGVYPITATGVSGGLNKTANFTVTVPGSTPDFAISVNTTNLTIEAASSDIVSVNVTKFGGFTDTPTLEITGAIIGTGEDKIEILGNNSFILLVGRNVMPGVYVLKVTATSGSLVHSLDFTVTVVASFYISAISSTVAVNAGSSGNLDVELYPSGGFSNAVNLAFSGDQVGTGADKIAVSSTFTNNIFAVTLAVGANVPAGKYTIIATGTSGSLTRETNFTVTVLSANVPFSFVLSPATITYALGNRTPFVGITIARPASLIGAIDLVLEGDPRVGPIGAGKINGAAVSTTSDSASMKLTIDAAVPIGTYNLTVRGTSGSYSSTSTFTLNVVAQGTITFFDAPLFLGLRGKNGQQFTFICPPNISISSIWGTDVYTDDSRICSAAVHAGKITKLAGGTVTIEISAGLSSYTGSTRNGVTSRDYEAYSGSYSFK